MHQAKKASPSSRSTLTRWFERLNNLIYAFDEYFLRLVKNILTLVRAGRADVVVKMVKIAEVEGKEDEKVVIDVIHYNVMVFYIPFKAIAIRLVKKAAKMDAAS